MQLQYISIVSKMASRTETWCNEISAFVLANINIDLLALFKLNKKQ